MKGAHLKSGWINKALIGHSFASTINFDTSRGPKLFLWFTDIWRSREVPTNSFLSIEIYTICYLAICDCS